jgi:peptidoglycan/LPS O-acetylase OafA/YrhL
MPPVESAVAPPPGNPRFPHVDGLRAIAALSVLVFHTAFFAGAFGTTWWGDLAARLEIGVTIFFAISGFLLYRPYFAAHYADSPPPRARDFYRRRVLRIVPAYWLALTALAIYPGLLGVFGPDWWVFYGFGQIYSQETFTQGIPQAWTLCVEATFYLALPFYALAMRRLGRGLGRTGRLRLELAVLGVLSSACLAMRIVVIGSGPSVLPYTLLGLFDWFAVGMALALVSVWASARASAPGWLAALGRRPEACWVGAGAVFVLLSVLVPAPAGGIPYGELDFHAINVLSPIVAMLLLIPAIVATGGGGPVRGLLGSALLGWLGLVSYGIYLWQAELLGWIAGRGVSGFLPLLALGAAATVVAAAVSYYVVERPILRFKDRRWRAG